MPFRRDLAHLRLNFELSAAPRPSLLPNMFKIALPIHTEEVHASLKSITVIRLKTRCDSQRLKRGSCTRLRRFGFIQLFGGRNERRRDRHFRRLTHPQRLN